MKRFDVVRRKGMNSTSATLAARRRRQIHDADFDVWYDKPPVPITKRQKMHHEFGVNRIKNILARYKDCFFSKPGSLAIKILYSIEGITMDHFHRWFNSYTDVSGIHLDGNVLVVPIPQASYTHLIQSYKQNYMGKLVQELMEYFNEDGMDEWFTDIWEWYAVRTAATSEPEELQKHKAMENINRLNGQARQARAKVEHAKIRRRINDDFQAIRDTRITTHCRTGKLW